MVRMTFIKTSRHRKAQPNIKPGVPKHQVPTTASPSIGTSPESEWVIDFRNKLDIASFYDDAGISSKLCVYRVPQYLRERDADRYIPRVVSLGPYHHERVLKLNHHKRRAVYHMLKRTHQDIKLYIDAVKRLEERVRACYEPTFHLSSEQFVGMMVLDGCFILELFQGVAKGFDKLGYSESDPIFSMQGPRIQLDMLLLENQIPLFVLDLLLGLQLEQPELKGVVSKLAVRFLNPLCLTDEPSPMEMEYTTTFDSLEDVQGLHCLDVFRRALLQKGPQPTPPIWGPKWSTGNTPIHCVTVLRESGVNFKKKETYRLWDIEFEDGVLTIPRLLIDYGTESLFLNLIAFEQCHLSSTNYITLYLKFMDNLINSAEDVRILHRCGIIENLLGSEAEVAELFNSICKKVVLDGCYSYLLPLSDRVNQYVDQYCKNRWNTWREILYDKYFNSPWRVISIIAAVVLLLLTFTQTLYGVYAYYRPPS